MNISKQAIEVFEAAWGRQGGSNRQRNTAGLEAVFAHLRGEGKQAAGTPPAVNKRLAVDDADVERVARAMWEVHDDGPWELLNKYSQNFYRASATAAIRAMNGQLWGIWAIPTDKRATPQREEWYDLTGADRFYTTDKSFCESIVANAAGLGMNTDWFRFEVRPYTAPREESAEEISGLKIAQEIADLCESGGSNFDIINSLGRMLDKLAEKRGTARSG